MTKELEETQEALKKSNATIDGLKTLICYFKPLIGHKIIDIANRKWSEMERKYKKRKFSSILWDNLSRLQNKIIT
ncbi:hypothetical protein B1F79_05185 [Coxiella-like endosymbiont of Rhipicephalus sanguineus]|nr:hypothetical protein [Coxiella-like endosymbiont of Rhipicephalus sanguineus]